jgi:tRNA threonylcarbamoyladenosine biosynthesis protein TsaE
MCVASLFRSLSIEKLANFEGGNLLNQEIKERYLSTHSIELKLCAQDVPKLCVFLAETLCPLDWILLEGDLGAGKTFFVSELYRALSLFSVATSPTFPILNVVDLERERRGIRRVCHLDLYRIERSEELLHLGLELEVTAKSLVLLEWPNNIDTEGWKFFFQMTRCKRPQRVIKIRIERTQQPQERLYFIRSLEHNNWLDEET